MLFNRSPKPAASVPPVEEPKIDPAPAPAPEAPPAEVPFISKEEFTNFQTTMLEKFDNVTNFFMRQNAPQTTQQAVPVIQIEDVSDEDYADAVAGNITDKHKAASIVQKRHTAIAKRENLILQQRFDQLQSVGMGAIGNLTMQTLTVKPHYTTYKKEIDAAIAQLPPEARVNSEALEGVYKYIIGGHIDEIMVKERETALRQAAPKPDMGVPSGRSGSSAGTASSGVPTPQDSLEPLALAAIRDKYGSTGPEAIERFVRSQGQKSWDEYYTRFLKPFEDAQGNA